MPSYPLLCLAAQYSQRVYTKPTGKERETHVEANWRMGTKAMVIKSVPVDDMNTIVFAIRGSQTFMDWAVNLNSAPVSPGEFLVSPSRLVVVCITPTIFPFSSRILSFPRDDQQVFTITTSMTARPGTLPGTISLVSIESFYFLQYSISLNSK